MVKNFYTRVGAKRMPIGKVSAMTTPSAMMFAGVSTRAIDPANVRAATKTAATAVAAIVIAQAARCSPASRSSAT